MSQPSAAVCKKEYASRMAASTSGTPSNATQRLLALGATLEELFNEQYDRIAFHKNEEENEYRRNERQLAGVMVDPSVTNEERIKAAEQILSLIEQYTTGFIGPFNALNEKIEKHLVELQEILKTLPVDTDEGKFFTQWFVLSYKLQIARIPATEHIAMTVNLDRFLPEFTLRKNGRSEINLSPEEYAKFTGTLEFLSSTLKKSHEENEAIQKERLPLSNVIIQHSQSAKSQAQPSAESTNDVLTKSVHPLEGKIWFRFAKVLYILLIIVVLGFSLLIGMASNNALYGAIAAIVGAGVLVMLRKGFYYITLGRTTAIEPEGSGFFDLDDFQKDIGHIATDNPELYRKVVQPYLQEWRTQYGRRVPSHLMIHLRKCVSQEVGELRRKREQLVDKATKEGKTVDVSEWRARMEKAKAEYTGADLMSFCSAVNNRIFKLEAKYGTSMPLEDFVKMLKELESDLPEYERSV
jgi:hypothetical protein